MTQRTLAAVIALPLVVVLVILAWVLPLPYTIYRPGPTVNVLPTVKIDSKHVQTFPDTGEIRMTTVSETLRNTHLGLWSLMQAWLAPDAAVYPRAVAYPDQTQTTQQDQQQGQVQMTSAQDAAAVVALEKLGYHVLLGAKVVQVGQNDPATGVLRPGDIITAVDGHKVTTAAGLVDVVQRLKPGNAVVIHFTRRGQKRSATITPTNQGGTAHIGVNPIDAIHMPFPVKVGLPPSIGGPSAGLMMALAIYDYLTPGSLTGGQPIAGTGEIEDNGAVAPIGGIQQKIPGAMNAGAKLFLVPADNCEDVAGANHGDMRLVRVTSFGSALKVIRSWVKDPNASLPTCGSAS